MSFPVKRPQKCPRNLQIRVKYIERIQNVDAPIGEDYQITCNQIFSDVELTEQYSINFYGGFRNISTKTYDFETKIATYFRSTRTES